MSSIKLPEIMQRLQQQQDAPSSSAAHTSGSSGRRRRRRRSNVAHTQQALEAAARRRPKRSSRGSSHRSTPRGSRRLVNVGFVLIGVLLLGVLGLGLYRYASVNSAGYATALEQQLKRQFGASEVRLQGLALVPGKLSASRLSMAFEQGWVQKLELQGLECEIGWLDLLLGNWNSEVVKVNQAEVLADGVWSLQNSQQQQQAARADLQSHFKFNLLQASSCNFVWIGLEGSPLVSLRGSVANCQLHAKGQMSFNLSKGQLQTGWWQDAGLIQASLQLVENAASLRAEVDFYDKKPLLLQGSLLHDGREYLQLSASSSHGNLSTLTRGRWDWLLQAELKDFQYRMQLFGNGALQYDLQAQADKGELKTCKVLQQLSMFTTNKNYTQPKLLAPFKLHLQCSADDTHQLQLVNVLEPGFLSLHGTLQMDFADQLQGTLYYGLPELLVQRAAFADNTLGFLPAQNGFCHLPVSYSGTPMQPQSSWPQNAAKKPTVSPASPATPAADPAASQAAQREEQALRQLEQLLSEQPAQ